MALVQLETIYDPMTAEIVRGRLQSAGIDAVVLDGQIASLIGPGVSGVRLLVEDGDAADARALLADFE